MPADTPAVPPQVRVHEWADLLRHKAAALRAVRGAALRPGELDAAALAIALARSQTPAPRGSALPPRTIDEVWERAYRLWDSVADPDDPQASEALAAQCDEVAGLLDAVSE